MRSVLGAFSSPVFGGDEGAEDSAEQGANDLTALNVNTRDAVVGHLSAGVPGTVAGLWEAHQRFGRLPCEPRLGNSSCPADP